MTQACVLHRFPELASGIERWLCGCNILDNPSLIGSFPSMSHFPHCAGVSWTHLLNKSLALEFLSRSLLSWESPKRQLAVIVDILLCAMNRARHLKHILSFSLIKKKKMIVEAIYPHYSQIRNRDSEWLQDAPSQ